MFRRDKIDTEAVNFYKRFFGEPMNHYHGGRTQHVRDTVHAINVALSEGYTKGSSTTARSARISELESEQKALKSNIYTKSQEAKALASKASQLQSLTSQVQSLNSEASSHYSKITSLNAELSNEKKQSTKAIADLKSQCQITENGNQSRINSLRSQLSEAKECLQARSNKISDLEQAIKEAAERNAQQENLQAQDLLDEIEQLEKQLSEKSALPQLNAFQGHDDELEQQQFLRLR